MLEETRFYLYKIPKAKLTYALEIRLSTVGGSYGETVIADWPMSWTQVIKGSSPPPTLGPWMCILPTVPTPGAVSKM